MVNNDRIVPVQKIDLLSLYGTILNLSGATVITILPADDVEGTFTVPNDAEGAFLCNQPVKTFIGDLKTAPTMFFVADYGFTAPEGYEEIFADVVKDAVTLHQFGASGVRVITPMVEKN